MRNLAAGLRAGALLVGAFWGAGLFGADTSTVTYPFLGVTHIFRAGSPPEFPRNVRMHIVKIDLTAPFISFKLPPRGGTRDTLKMRTLDYINLVGAQIGMNAHFFNPVTSPTTPGGISADLNTELIGFGASAGDVISPFELPFQNYAIVRDSPGLNIDPYNNASIVTAAPGFSDGSCESCLANDGLHVRENVTIWNTISGSAQTITNGVKTIPCYRDATHPDCQLDGSLSPTTVIPPYSNTKSWYDLLNARTAVGLSQDQKTLFLFTVDAAGGSAGMMIGEVADLLIRDYGVYNALSCDGGGSVSLAMEDPVTHVRSLINSQSNGAFAREVASSLAVFASSMTDVTHSVNTSPAGLAFSVDGSLFTSGQNPTWSYGSSHTLATISPQPGSSGTRYAFNNWSDNGAISHLVSGLASATNYTANFDTQYQLTTAVSPAAAGTVTPATGGYSNAGSTASLQATPGAGYVFQGWSGPVAAPSSASTTVTLTGPVAVTANFVPGPTTLSGIITAKSGPPNARISTITLANVGPGVANAARIDGVTLSQTSGPACTPVFASALPLAVGNTAPGASASGNVTVDYTGCAPANRYTLVLTYSANGGAVTGSKTLYNQFQ
jgi:hypothetical protein